MQAQTIRQVPAPTPPPALPGPYIVPVSQVPQTAAEVRALREKINQLTDQVQDFASRRQTVASNLRRADESARPGFIARLDNLDKSINALQDQITQANLAIAQAPASALSGSTGFDPNLFPDRVGRSIVPVVAILSVFVFFPLVLVFVRNMWKRASAPPARPVVDQSTMLRLDALQQSVDTIAIEVERISEGQRFMTKVLGERHVLGAGAAEPVRVDNREAVGAKRKV